MTHWSSQEVPQIISLLEEGFQAFIDVHVKCYSNYRDHGPLVVP